MGGRGEEGCLGGVIGWVGTGRAERRACGSVGEPHATRAGQWRWGERHGTEQHYTPGQSERQSLISTVDDRLIAHTGRRVPGGASEPLIPAVRRAPHAAKRPSRCMSCPSRLRETFSIDGSPPCRSAYYSICLVAVCPGRQPLPSYCGAHCTRSPPACISSSSSSAVARAARCPSFCMSTFSRV